MRQVRRTAARSLTAAILSAALALRAAAGDVVYLDRDRDRGFSLPGVSLPRGQDEVRAADGTSCRSAVGGSGAYLDMGAIKDGMDVASGDVSTYARVVVPLGSRSSRLDCSKLYELEIERLRAEVRLMKMGLAAPDRAGEEDGAASEDGRADWTADGWSRKGVAAGADAASPPGRRKSRKAAARP